MMYLPSDPDFYRDLPRVLANQPEQNLTRDEIKFVKSYRKAKHSLDEVPQPGLGQCFFSAIGHMLVRWGNRMQEQEPAPRRDYAQERN